MVDIQSRSFGWLGYCNLTQDCVLSGHLGNSLPEFNFRFLCVVEQLNLIFRLFASLIIIIVGFQTVAYKVCCKHQEGSSG